MLNKINIFFLIFFIFNFSLFSEELLNDYYDTTTFFSAALQKEENRFLSSAGNLYEKLTFVRKMHDILLDFLYLADDDSYYDQLKFSKPFIDRMKEVTDDIFDQIYQDRICDRRSMELNGVMVYVYYNLFSQSKLLTDKERTEFYEEEIRLHQNVKMLPKRFLNKEALKTLLSGQTYNYVVNLQNEVYISYDQRYRLKNDEKKYILNSPNHTMLAGDAPILSAGVIKFYKVGRKELYFISCSSGHFHPSADSAIHIRNYLIELGIPEEAIITLSATYETIVSETHKIKYTTSAL